MAGKDSEEQIGVVKEAQVSTWNNGYLSTAEALLTGSTLLPLKDPEWQGRLERGLVVEDLLTVRNVLDGKIGVEKAADIRGEKKYVHAQALPLLTRQVGAFERKHLKVGVELQTDENGNSVSPWKVVVLKEDGKTLADSQDGLDRLLIGEYLAPSFTLSTDPETHETFVRYTPKAA
ncbi:MAG TPA: hypothetical protein VHE53_04840 [Patescibacteria group bacterium]|nr:hypothetical protein [Patescibacteria group bacterium]